MHINDIINKLIYSVWKLLSINIGDINILENSIYVIFYISKDKININHCKLNKNSDRATAYRTDVPKNYFRYKRINSKIMENYQIYEIYHSKSLSFWLLIYMICILSILINHYSNYTTVLYRILRDFVLFE